MVDREERPPRRPGAERSGVGEPLLQEAIRRVARASVEIAGDDAEIREAIHVHSKLLIVDDRVLCVGSANLTNRSMSVDSELELTWEFPADDPRATAIGELRARLVAHHAGQKSHARFADRHRLVEALDAEVRSWSSRLRVHPCMLETSGERPGLASVLFDPDKPLDEIVRDDCA